MNIRAAITYVAGKGIDNVFPYRFCIVNLMRVDGKKVWLIKWGQMQKIASIIESVELAEKEGLSHLGVREVAGLKDMGIYFYYRDGDLE